MAKISKSVVDNDLRTRIFNDILTNVDGFINEFVKINDRQYGCILTDLNGVERYVRLGAIVAEEREDMTARELMKSEIKAYNDAQANKAEKARKAAEKAAADKAKREAKAAEKATKEADYSASFGYLDVKHPNTVYQLYNILT